MPYDVVIIGAGPAGLFCAIHAADPGRRVLLLEKNPQPGAKLLLAGSGQCNLTHDGEIREFVTHYGDHGKFVKPALMSFTNRDLMAFFRDRGLAMVTEENGKVFPADTAVGGCAGGPACGMQEPGRDDPVQRDRCGQCPGRTVVHDHDRHGTVPGQKPSSSRRAVHRTRSAGQPVTGTALRHRSASR